MLFLLCVLIIGPGESFLSIGIFRNIVLNVCTLPKIAVTVLEDINFAQRFRRKIIGTLRLSAILSEPTKLISHFTPELIAIRDRFPDEFKILIVCE